MRGCFLDPAKREGRRKVLPAYAGMFLWLAIASIVFIGSPCVCGDVSQLAKHANEGGKFSPRMRGCFYSLKHGDKTIQVIPAQRR